MESLKSEILKTLDVLKRGGIILYPTDTVYGLGCDITNTKALERIAKIKGVKLEKSNFSFVCEDLSNLSDYVKQIDSTTFKILKRALPGPYTFILPGAKTLPVAFKKKKTVGIRVPKNNIALDIVRELGNPIVSTSIRDDDEILEYTTDPELILEKWGNLVDAVIDGENADLIDQALVEFGMPMGPIELADQIGLDVCLDVGVVLGIAPAAKTLLTEKCDAGTIGRKSGSGFYDWDGNRAIRPRQPQDAAIMAGIVKSMLAPMIDECQQAVDDGVVDSVDSADAGMIFGIGFPGFRGGPLNWAKS